MSAESDDNLSKALTLLKQTANSAQCISRHSSRSAGPPDIGELFLEELRLRRARLREWIEMLNQEAGGATAPQLPPAAARMAPQGCRRRNRRRIRRDEQV